MPLPGINVDDPARYHFLEPGAPEDVRRAIFNNADHVAARLRNLTNCLEAVMTWSQVLAAAGIPHALLGRQGTSDRGGYLEPGSDKTTDHHYLAIGHGLYLFDPTAGQFEQPVTLERYVVADGTPFVKWRIQQLQLL